MDASRVKSHLKKHRELYIGLAGGVVLAGIAYVIVRGNSYRTNDIAATTLVDKARDATTLVDKSQTIIRSHISNSHIGNVTNNYNVKRLSYIISDPETKQWWRSQSEAAKDLGISETRLSRYFNHGDQIPGVELIREGVVSN